MIVPRFHAIVYVSVGDACYARMCLDSIASLRAWGYAGDVFIITDQTDVPWPKDRTLIHQVPSSPGLYSSRHWKTQIGLLSPFARNLFLDCDILATADLSQIWRSLEEEEIGFASDLYPTLRHALTNEENRPKFSEQERSYTEETTPIDSPYYNAGVISWQKNAASDRFFSTWHSEWKRFSGRDQYAMARAIHLSAVPVLHLAETYNSPSFKHLTLSKAVNRQVLFVHFWDDKKAFHSFVREIAAFKALDPKTQEELLALFHKKSFRHRDSIQCLSLMRLHRPLASLRLLAFLCRSFYSILRERVWREMTPEPAVQPDPGLLGLPADSKS